MTRAYEHAQSLEQAAARETDDAKAAAAYREAAHAYLVAADAAEEAGDKKASSRLKKLAGRAEENAEQAGSESEGELLLFMDNDYDLYKQKDAFIKNVWQKMKRGKYDPVQGQRLWLYYVDRGAKRYAEENAPDNAPSQAHGAYAWNKLFPKPVRERLAVEIERRERRAIQSGEYDKYPPVGAARDPRRTARRATGARRRSSSSRASNTWSSDAVR